MTWDQGFNNGAEGIYYTVYATYTDSNGVVQNLSTLNRVNQINDRSFYAEDLIVGTEYQVQVVASNICGASPRSAALLLTAGTVPGQPCPVYTQSQPDDRVTCTWGNAAANGFPIYGYKVMIQSADDTFHNVVASCAEAVQQRTSSNNNQFYYNQLTLAGNTCTLTEASLRTLPFNLPETASVNCQVIATNVMGDSQACTGNGAVMPVLATIPGTCQDIRFVSRASGQVSIGW